MLEFVASIPRHGMRTILVVVIYGLWYSCCSDSRVLFLALSHHLCRHVRRLYQEFFWNYCLLTTIRVFLAPDSCVLTHMDCLGSVVLTVNQCFFFSFCQDILCCIAR
jgi:hypothetical protein